MIAPLAGVYVVLGYTPPIRRRPREGHDEEAPGDGDLAEEDAAVEEDLELPEPPDLLNHFLQVVTCRLHVGINLPKTLRYIQMYL